MAANISRRVRMWPGLPQIASLMSSEILSGFLVTARGSSGRDHKITGIGSGIDNVLRRYASLS